MMLQCLQILGEPINIKTNMSFLLGIVHSTLSYVPFESLIIDPMEDAEDD